MANSAAIRDALNRVGGDPSSLEIKCKSIKEARMKFQYCFYKHTLRPDYEGDDVESEEIDSGVDSLRDIMTTAARKYGIRAHEAGICMGWWGSDEPEQDREYFEKGIEKRYTLHIVILSTANQTRANNVLRSLWGRGG